MQSPAPGVIQCPGHVDPHRPNGGNPAHAHADAAFQVHTAALKRVALIKENCYGPTGQDAVIVFDTMTTQMTATHHYLFTLGGDDAGAQRAKAVPAHTGVTA